MLYDVIDRFLENEKDFAPDVCAEHYVGFVQRRAKIEIDVPRSQDVSRKAPHALFQIAEMILLGVDGPDDVAHGVDQFTRSVGNHRQLRSVLAVATILNHFAHDRYLRQARSDVIVKICSDAAADAFQLAQALFSRALQSLGRLLSLRYVADDAGKESPVIPLKFAE